MIKKILYKYWVVLFIWKFYWVIFYIRFGKYYYCFVRAEKKVMKIISMFGLKDIIFKVICFGFVIIV